MHVHKYQETVIITKGKCKVCVADKTYEMKAGDFVFIDSNVKQSFVNGDSELEFFCAIDYTDDRSNKDVRRRVQVKGKKSKSLVIRLSLFSEEGE
jgi:quercetin dioxygenase-like cupin family protein